jgi:hypothetical protein
MSQRRKPKLSGFRRHETAKHTDPGGGHGGGGGTSSSSSSSSSSSG